MVKRSEYDHHETEPSIDAAINVPVANAAREEARMAFCRQKQRDAMARLRSNLTPKEKESRRKQNRDAQRKRRATMTPEQLTLK